jgi:hypothetical protein
LQPGPELGLELGAAVCEKMGVELESEYVDATT